MKNEALQKELRDLLQDRFTTSDSVLVNFAKGEDAYDPVKSGAVIFPNSNEELSQVFLLYHSLSLLLLSHKHALISKKIFCLTNTILAKMKNTRSEHSICFS